MISGISQVCKNTDDLCAELEQNYLEFKAFAEGHPDFLAVLPGPRFMCFPEFVEENEPFLQSATLEDFMIAPLKEFSKIVEVMSVDLDLRRLHLASPRTMPYRYLAVKEKAPRFRETKRRIERRSTVDV